MNWKMGWHIMVIVLLFAISCGCTSPTPNKKVVLIVDSEIEPDIRDSLEQFSHDLEIDRYTVIKHILVENSPEELRAYLFDLYQDSTPPLFGAIFIGNIPKPYFRIYYPESNGCPERGPYEIISFQFYQDLNGTYSCSNPENCNHTGCYDTHSGEIDSEIWVSVLPFYLDRETTIDRINSYFKKNHESRMGLRRPEAGFICSLIGASIDTPEAYQQQVDYFINSQWAWKPLTSRGNILVGPDNSLGDLDNYPNAAYCYEQAMMTDEYDFAEIGSHGRCTSFGEGQGGSISINVDWANTHHIKPLFLWDHSCNTGDIDCQPNLLSAFLYNPNNNVILAKGATGDQGGLGSSLNGDSHPYIGGLLSQGYSFGEAILSHINSEFVDCCGQQREYFVAQFILLGDGTLKLPEFIVILLAADPNEAAVLDGKDFRFITLYKTDHNLKTTIEFYRDIQLDEFYYYFSTDTDMVAEIQVRCESDKFEAAAETRPGFYSDVLYTGTPTVTGDTYTLVFPWQTVFGSSTVAKFWLYASDGKDRLPNSGNRTVNW
jgi:hypothetical protein